MEEDEGLPEIVLDFGNDECMLVDEHAGEEAAYKYGREEVVYEHNREEAVYKHSGEEVAHEHGEEEAVYGHSGKLMGYDNGYGMEPCPRYDPGYQQCAPPACAPEFFQTLPTLAPSAHSLQGVLRMHHAAAPPLALHNHTAVGAMMPDLH